MKKAIQIFAVVIGAILLSSFMLKSTNDKPMYYVCVGQEWPKIDNKIVMVVTNVVYVDCKHHFNGSIAVQLTKFYDAYYKDIRGTKHLDETNAAGYDTWDKAEKARRDKITTYKGYGWKIYLIDDFSVLCDD